MRLNSTVKLLLLFVLVSCGPQEPADLSNPNANGEQEMLRFVPRSFSVGGNSLVAKSASLDVTVWGPETCSGGCGDSMECDESIVRLVEATSSDPDVFEAEVVEDRAWNEPNVRIRATGEGSAMLRVSASVSTESDTSEVVEDSFEFKVAAPDRFEFIPKGTSVEPSQFVFLGDQEIPMGFSYHRGREQLGGYGHIPLHFQPEDGGVAFWGEDVHYFSVIGAAADEPVRLVAEVGDHEYSMHFIDQREIDELGVKVRARQFWSDELFYDGGRAELEKDTGNFDVQVHAFSEDLPVYVPAITVRLSVDDASVCRVSAHGVPYEEQSVRGDFDIVDDNFLDITLLAPGTCPLTVEHVLPEGEVGATMSLDVVVSDPEDEE